MDARIRYTKMIIKETMLDMINEIDISKITVKALCERAKINRATFYRYYSNPYDLLDKMEQDLLDDLEKAILESGAHGFQEEFKVILKDIKKNIRFYTLLFSANGDERFRHRLYSLCYGINMNKICLIYKNLDDKRREWIYYFIAEGSNGILHKWIQGGMTEPEDEIVDFVEKIVQSINKELPGRL